MTKIAQELISLIQKWEGEEGAKTKELQRLNTLLHEYRKDVEATIQQREIDGTGYEQIPLF